MNEYSRPATFADLKMLIASLNEQGARYLLIGGYALFAHGYHRATVDIDVLIPAIREDGLRVRSALMVLPDQAARDIDPAWFEEGENIRVADAFVVDVMFNACGESYETLLQYAETVDLDGVAACTISLEGLLRTKQSMREKDVADRIILERALAVMGASSRWEKPLKLEAIEITPAARLSNEQRLREMVLSIDPQAKFARADADALNTRYIGLVAAQADDGQPGFVQHQGKSVYTIHEFAVPTDHRDGVIEITYHGRDRAPTVTVSNQRTGKTL